GHLALLDALNQQRAAAVQRNDLAVFDQRIDVIDVVHARLGLSSGQLRAVAIAAVGLQDVLDGSLVEVLLRGRLGCARTSAGASASAGPRLGIVLRLIDRRRRAGRRERVGTRILLRR